MLAEIYINLPVKSIAGVFTYIIPPQLGPAELGPGWRVLAPFGGRKVEGFIVRVFSEDTPGRGIRWELAEAAGEKIYLARDSETGKEYRLKPISGLVDERPWFTPRMLEAARQIADFYLCAPAEAMRLFMPGKSGVSISRKNGIKKREKAIFEKLVTLRDNPADSQPAKARLGPRQEALLTALRENGGTISQRQLRENTTSFLPPLPPWWSGSWYRSGRSGSFGTAMEENLKGQRLAGGQSAPRRRNWPGLRLSPLNRRP